MSRLPMLIVNADDWGGSAALTDAIDACFIRGAITSATAMMFMTDSRRAAELALARQYPIGLHLNLTQPLAAPETPPMVRERQLQACAHFASLRRRRLLISPNPRVHTLIADCIRDQLDEFHERYGCQPTHLDSHHHVHTSPDVFLSRSIARGSLVRQTISPSPMPVAPLERLDLALLIGRARHELLYRLCTTTDRLWRPAEVYSGRGAVTIETAARAARSEAVEMMVHLQHQPERELLYSDHWAASLANARLASYEDLGAALTPRYS